MIEIHNFLISAGYTPRTEASNLVYRAITRAFELLGEPCSDLLISHLSTMHKLPRHIVLTRYDLISKAIGQIFGYGSEVFLHEIRENLLQSLLHLDRTLGTAQIVEEAFKFEALRFASDLTEGHAILLCSNYASRQQVVDAFFQRKSAIGIVRFRGLEMARYDGEGNVVAGARVYCNLVSCHHRPEKRDAQSPARVFLCACSLEEASKDLYESVLSHDHVVTDRPFMVYSRK
jgi:hypothetical protein